MLRNFIEKDLNSWFKVTLILWFGYVFFYAPLDVYLTGKPTGEFGIQISYCGGVALHYLTFYWYIPRFLFRKFMGLVRKFSPAKA